MSAAGCHRHASLLRAENATDYAQIRSQEQHSGVDFTAIAAAELANQTTVQDDHPAMLNGLVARAIRVNDEFLAKQQQMHAQLAQPDAIAEAVTTAVAGLEGQQNEWAGLAVAQIMVAASLRGGDYTKVPFFEPKSITDQKALIYPL